MCFSGSSGRQAAAARAGGVGIQRQVGRTALETVTTPEQREYFQNGNNPNYVKTGAPKGGRLAMIYNAKNKAAQAQGKGGAMEVKARPGWFTAYDAKGMYQYKPGSSSTKETPQALNRTGVADDSQLRIKTRAARADVANASDTSRRKARRGRSGLRIDVAGVSGSGLGGAGVSYS